MIQMLFSFRFRSQVRRTRGDVWEEAETALLNAIAAAGGTLATEHRVITAVFSEERLGSRLELLVLVETIVPILEKARDSLFGAACIFRRFDEQNDDTSLLSAMPLSEGTGIWFDAETRALLTNYAQFGRGQFALNEREQAGASLWYELIALNPAGEGGEEASVLATATAKKAEAEAEDEASRGIMKENPENTALLGRQSVGKTRLLARLVKKMLPSDEKGASFPPLVLRFSHNRSGFAAFADAFSPAIRQLCADDDDELEKLAEFLAKMRLCTQYSAFSREKLTAFWRKLLTMYQKKAAEWQKIGKVSRAVVVIDDLKAMDDVCRAIFTESLTEMSEIDAGTATLLASNDGFFLDDAWKALFPVCVEAHFYSSGGAGRGVFAANGDLAHGDLAQGDLASIAYLCAVLSDFFPCAAFSALFAETGGNPAMFSRALDLLCAKNIIPSREEPLPDRALFDDEFMATNKASVSLVHSLARGLLLSRLAEGKLQPCYHLLTQLRALGGTVDCQRRGAYPAPWGEKCFAKRSSVCTPESNSSWASNIPRPLGRGYVDSRLALDALYADIKNNTVSEIEAALASGRFAAVAGEENAAPLSFIFRALYALSFGSRDEINAAFSDADGSRAGSVERPFILTLNALYRLSRREAAPALLVVKDAIYENQNVADSHCTARVFRLAGLVYFAENHINEAIDYLNFAVETGEKARGTGTGGLPHEYMMSLFFAGNVQFVWGNISKALRLMRRAAEEGRAHGNLGWAERAEFLAGRFLFELGDYEEAAETWRHLRAEGASHYDDEGAAAEHKIDIIDAWIFRADTYLALERTQHLFHPFPAVDTPAPLEGTLCGAHRDACLFRLEYLFFTGDFEGALRAADTFLAEHRDEPFVYLEQSDWTTGFSPCEIMQRDGEDYWTEQVAAWRILALLMQGGDNVPLRAAMKKLTPAERVSPLTDVLLHYLYFFLLQQTEANEVDKNTALGIAFKHLQTRASRIDELAAKRSYTDNNYWNKRLLTAAQENRLM